MSGKKLGNVLQDFHLDETNFQSLISYEIKLNFSMSIQ